MTNGFTILKFACIDVNSLLSKVLFINHLIEKLNLSAVAVCETWLVPGVPSSFVSIDGFRVVRGDGSDTWLLFVHFGVLFVCSC